MNTLTQENKRVQKLTQAALCAALCYIGFTFFKIDIPVGTEKSAIHFGNIFCVLAALLTSGLYGGLAGAVGMTIADLTSGYATSVGVVAHRILKLNKEEHSARYIIGATFLSAAAGMAFNILADPLVGYFYKTYLFGIPQDLSVTLAKIGAITTSINAVTATIISSILYLALRPVLKKCDLL